jgi:glycosyltransferase involved in cell wall biosynthesis
MGTQLRRVCFIRHGNYPGSIRTRKEAEALAQQGHLVDVLCLRDKPDQPLRETIDGVTAYRLPLQHARGGKIGYVVEYLLSFIMFTCLVSFLQLTKRYHVIQISNMPDLHVFATVFAKLLGAKIIFDLHECMPEIFQVKYELDERHPLVGALRWIEQGAIAFADHAITCNEEMKRIFVARGADPSKFSIFLNTSNEAIFRREHNGRSPNGHFRLVTHGAIEERYGIATAVRALALAKEQVPGIEFEIFGSGTAREDLEQLAVELGVRDQIRFRGFVPIDELVAALNAADVGVVTILQHPAMRWVHTNKMFDFMAVNKPIVISRLKALEDYFDDACLMYFDNNDPQDMARALIELYRDPERRESQSRESARVYDQLKWSVQSTAYCRLIEQL